MTADVHHVIDPAQDPVVAIMVAARGVAGEIGARDLAPILFFVALVIAPDAANHAGPRLLQYQIAFVVGRDWLAFEIHNFRHDSRHRQCARPWLQRYGTGHRRDQDAAGFGLPPGVDNGTATAA